MHTSFRTSVWLLITLAGTALAAPVEEQIRAQEFQSELQLSWHDEDDTLTGVASPPRPRVGQQVTVAFTLGAYYGKTEGKLRIAVRHAGHTLLEQSFERGPKVQIRFAPEEAGDYVVDVLFQSTRAKVLHLPLSVSEGDPSRWWGIGALAAVALFVGLWFASQRSRAQAREAVGPDPTGGLVELPEAAPKTPKDAAPGAGNDPGTGAG